MGCMQAESMGMARERADREPNMDRFLDQLSSKVGLVALCSICMACQPFPMLFSRHINTEAYAQ